jgi:hypothetical protein
MGKTVVRDDRNAAQVPDGLVGLSWSARHQGAVEATGASPQALIVLFDLMNPLHAGGINTLAHTRSPSLKARGVSTD